MAAQRVFSSIFFLVVLALACLSISSAADSKKFTRSSCNKTRYTDVCYATLENRAMAIKKNNVETHARAVLKETRDVVKLVASHISKLKAGKTAKGDLVEALDDCSTNFKSAARNIHDSLKQMKKLGSDKSTSKESFAFQMSNVQTWMSAALINEDICMTSLKGMDRSFQNEVYVRVEDAKKVTSNALAILDMYVKSKS